MEQCKDWDFEERECKECGEKVTHYVEVYETFKGVKCEGCDAYWREYYNSGDTSDISDMSDTEGVDRMVEQTLEQAKVILYKIDDAVNKLEGDEIHKAVLEMQDLISEWNLLAHNFSQLGVQDWLESGDMVD